MKEKGKRKQLPSLEGCKSERSLATKEFISRIGDKWSIMIVLALSRHEDSRARFSDLKKGIVGISQTMLTSTLRGLERDGIVEREVFPEVPPRVEYQLTKLGLSVLEPMKVLTEWTMINWDSVKRARAKYDSKL